MIDMEKYAQFLAVDKCFACKKKMNLYLTDGEGSFLNPNYLHHIKDTHGYPAFVILSQVEKMYQTEEGKQDFKDFMKRNYSHFEFMRDYV